MGDTCRRVINIMLALCTHFLSTQTALQTLNIDAFPSHVSYPACLVRAASVTVNQYAIIIYAQHKTTDSAPAKIRLRFSLGKKKVITKHIVATQMMVNGVPAY